MSDHQPQYPLYIPSKGRYDYMVTSKHLTKMGVPHYIIVEQPELDHYRIAIDQMGLNATVLELDPLYKTHYEKCDNLGLTRSTGPGPARNFAWDHSIAEGFAWHWVMDDNIMGFYRHNKNLSVPTVAPAWWKAQEDFCARYTNVAMAGPNYFMFFARRTKRPPFTVNTRIYSCNLIRNDIPFRWRGRYNEDTILSLDVLKGGWCTILFNAFLQNKMTTQHQKGGNTAEFYHAEGTVREGDVYADYGTLAKSQMLVTVHPDVSRIVHRFSRIHHHVDYNGFKRQKLIRKDDLELDPATDNYGMELKQL